MDLINQLGFEKVEKKEKERTKMKMWGEKGKQTIKLKQQRGGNERVRVSSELKAPE